MNRGRLVRPSYQMAFKVFDFAKGSLSPLDSDQGLIGQPNLRSLDSGYRVKNGLCCFSCFRVVNGPWPQASTVS